jgi:hypothetical protein
MSQAISKGSHETLTRDPHNTTYVIMCEQQFLIANNTATSFQKQTSSPANTKTKACPYPYRLEQYFRLVMPSVLTITPNFGQ